MDLTSDRKEEDLISIIVPVYNGARFLKEFSLPSVLGQTYKNWELIIVDDGSLDNTGEVIEEFRKRTDRIVYLKHAKNSGLAAAYNTGIRQAKGELIAFLEHDDIWLPKKLARQAEAMKSDKNYICSTSRCWLLDAGMMKIFGVAWASFSGLMIYRRVFDEVGFFDERPELFGMQDGDLKAMLDLTYASRNPDYYLKLSEPLIVFVRNDGSLSSRQNGGKQKFVKRYLAICDKYDRPEFNTNDAMREILNFWYAHLALNQLFVGDRRASRSSARRARQLKDDGAARLIYLLSYLPAGMVRTAYGIMDTGAKKFGGFRIRSEKKKYKEEYEEVVKIVQSI
jgi:glycosyltransferase involved in cell wall biosynthesis